MVRDLHTLSFQIKWLGKLYGLRTTAPKRTSEIPFKKACRLIMGRSPPSEVVVRFAIDGASGIRDDQGTFAQRNPV